MSDYDVIVVGGGPAGCYAALSAATNGLRVALFEEHGAIGWPRHDPGWLMESPFTKSLIRALGERIAWTKVKEFRVCDSESGEIMETSKLGGYLIMRDLLEKEIAALAIKAGAKIYLKTKVMKTISRNGKVEGVETNSKIIPRGSAEIVICADGIRSASNGLAVNEGLCEGGSIRPGISYLLSNAEVSAGVIEHFLSPDPSLNYKCFFTHHERACFFSASSYAAFDELKEREDNVISHKIKNACPLEVSGFTRGSSGKYGVYFKEIVKDNIIFVGDASGGAGNIHGMMQGHFAGMVAALAIKEKDTSKGRLAEYQDLVHDTLGKAPFFWFSAREDFGSFDNWFSEFIECTKGIEATELAYFK